MNVNFKGTVFVTQAFKPLMGKGASIVNFASQAVVMVVGLGQHFMLPQREQ